MSRVKLGETKMYIIYAQIGFITNRQTINKRFSKTGKSPIFKSHKS